MDRSFGFLLGVVMAFDTRVDSLVRESWILILTFSFLEVRK